MASDPVEICTVSSQLALLLLLSGNPAQRLDEGLESQFPLPRKVSHFSSATRRTFQPPFTRFDLLQLFLVAFTLAALGVLVAAVREGLLGNPEMFIGGNGSSRTSLQWFQPRSGNQLPMPSVVSVSVWFYRLLMLAWALWLTVALIRWLKWAWTQFSDGGCWRRFPRKPKSPPPIPPAKA